MKQALRDKATELRRVADLLDESANLMCELQGKQKQHIDIQWNGQNPAAVLGRLGGLKGGPARAKLLSPERRSEIATIAAKKRWTKP